MLSDVFQCTKEARLKPRTEDEAHNLTSDDPVWELVKAADQAVLATATPLKQVAELQGVARTSACGIWCLPEQQLLIPTARVFAWMSQKQLCWLPVRLLASG